MMPHFLLHKSPDIFGELNMYFFFGVAAIEKTIKALQLYRFRLLEGVSSYAVGSKINLFPD